MLIFNILDLFHNFYVQIPNYYTLQMNYNE